MNRRRERRSAQSPRQAHRRSVDAKGERILFSDEIRDGSLGEFADCVRSIERGGHTKIVADFGGCTAAFPDGMLPIVCAIDDLRSREIDVELIMPRDTRVRNLFENANWAHFLDPAHHRASSQEMDKHLPALRYDNASGQTGILNALINLLMRQMEVDRSVLSGLEWSANEITDNVLNHAEAPRGGFVQATTFAGTENVDFIVADAGQGILSSLREGLQNLRSDRQAIGEAIKQGVTSGRGQGNGLAGTLRIALRSGGLFRLSSGRGQLYVHALPDGGAEERFFKRPPLRGTVVQTRIGTSQGFDLKEALTFDGEVRYAEWDFIDAQHVERDHLVLLLSDETTGFGSRASGQAMRTKCKNLLRAEPHRQLVLDWGGVPLVSSSFADEFLGKLFAELGPLAFGQRIQMRAVEPLVRDLLDRAIRERIRQEATTGGD
jgi:hypothetical protein